MICVQQFGISLGLFVLLSIMSGCAINPAIRQSDTFENTSKQTDKNLGKTFWVSKNKRLNVLRKPDRYDYGFLTKGDISFTILSRVRPEYGTSTFYHIEFTDGTTGFLEEGDIDSFTQAGKLFVENPAISEQKYLLELEQVGIKKGNTSWLKLPQPPIRGLSEFNILSVGVFDEEIILNVTCDGAQGVLKFRNIKDWQKNTYTKKPDFGWSSDITAAIKDGRIKIGMTGEQVLASWGEPSKKHHSIGKIGTSEQWIYGQLPNSQYLHFDENVLTNIQD